MANEIQLFNFTDNNDKVDNKLLPSVSPAGKLTGEELNGIKDSLNSIINVINGTTTAPSNFPSSKVLSPFVFGDANYRNINDLASQVNEGDFINFKFPSTQSVMGYVREKVLDTNDVVLSRLEIYGWLIEGTKFRKGLITYLEVNGLTLTLPSKIAIHKNEYRWYPTNYVPDNQIWEKVSMGSGQTIIEGSNEGTTNGQVPSHNHRQGNHSHNLQNLYSNSSGGGAKDMALWTIIDSANFSGDGGEQGPKSVWGSYTGTTGSSVSRTYDSAYTGNSINTSYTLNYGSGSYNKSYGKYAKLYKAKVDVLVEDIDFNYSSSVSSGLSGQAGVDFEPIELKSNDLQIKLLNEASLTKITMKMTDEVIQKIQNYSLDTIFTYQGNEYTRQELIDRVRNYYVNLSDDVALFAGEYSLYSQLGDDTFNTKMQEFVANTPDFSKGDILNYLYFFNDVLELLNLDFNGLLTFLKKQIDKTDDSLAIHRDIPNYFNFNPEGPAIDDTTLSLQQQDIVDRIGDGYLVKVWHDIIKMSVDDNTGDVITISSSLNEVNIASPNWIESHKKQEIVFNKNNKLFENNEIIFELSNGYTTNPIRISKANVVDNYRFPLSSIRIDKDYSTTKAGEDDYLQLGMGVEYANNKITWYNNAQKWISAPDYDHEANNYAYATSLGDILKTFMNSQKQLLEDNGIDSPSETIAITKIDEAITTLTTSKNTLDNELSEQLDADFSGNSGAKSYKVAPTTNNEIYISKIIIKAVK